MADQEPENLSLKPDERFTVGERERANQKLLRAHVPEAATAPTASLSPPPLRHHNVRIYSTDPLYQVLPALDAKSKGDVKKNGAGYATAGKQTRSKGWEPWKMIIGVVGTVIAILIFASPSIYFGLKYRKSSTESIKMRAVASHWRARALAAEAKNAKFEARNSNSKNEIVYLDRTEESIAACECCQKCHNFDESMDFEPMRTELQKTTNEPDAKETTSSSNITSPNQKNALSESETYPKGNVTASSTSLPRPIDRSASNYKENNLDPHKKPKPPKGADVSNNPELKIKMHKQEAIDNGNVLPNPYGKSHMISHMRKIN